MDLFRSSVPQQAHHLACRCPAYDRIIHDDEALAGNAFAKRVQFPAYRVDACLWSWSDEGPANVAVLDESLTEWNSTSRRETLGRRYARIWHTYDEIHLDGCFRGELLSHSMPRRMDLPPIKSTVGAREIHEFEDAQTRVNARMIEGTKRSRTIVIDDDELAGFDLSDKLSTNDVKRRCL